MLGIALSGGGIRGIAHAGALKAFEDNNIKIDVIGGTSSGALVATLYALGYSPYYIFQTFKIYAKEIIGMNSSYVLSKIKSKFLGKEEEITGIKTGESLEKVYNKVEIRKGIKEISKIKKKNANSNNSSGYKRWKRIYIHKLCAKSGKQRKIYNRHTNRKGSKSK